MVGERKSIFEGLDCGAIVHEALLCSESLSAERFWVRVRSRSSLEVQSRMWVAIAV